MESWHWKKPWLNPLFSKCDLSVVIVSDPGILPLLRAHITDFLSFVFLLIREGNPNGSVLSRFPLQHTRRIRRNGGCIVMGSIMSLLLFLTSISRRSEMFFESRLSRTVPQHKCVSWTEWIAPFSRCWTGHNNSGYNIGILNVGRG